MAYFSGHHVWAYCACVLTVTESVTRQSANKLHERTNYDHEVHETYVYSTAFLSCVLFHGISKTSQNASGYSFRVSNKYQYLRYV